MEMLAATGPAGLKTSTESEATSLPAHPFAVLLLAISVCAMSRHACPAIIRTDMTVASSVPGKKAVAAGRLWPGPLPGAQSRRCIDEGRVGLGWWTSGCQAQTPDTEAPDGAFPVQSKDTKVSRLPTPYRPSPAPPSAWSVQAASRMGSPHPLMQRVGMPLSVA